MENRLDQSARGPTRAAAWRAGLRRLGRRLCRTKAQPFDFDGLAKDVAQGLSRREALQRLGTGLGGALLAALGLEGRAWSNPPGCGVACQAATGQREPAFTACVTACGACKDAGGAPCIAQGGVVHCCTSGQTCCSGICCNTSTDVHNCGGCGHGCTTQVANATPTCRSSACSFTCNPNYTHCGAACVDTQTDNNNCGQCGSLCPQGATCVSGSCVCPSSLPTVCGSYCVDTSSNPSHCGSCTGSCTSTQDCVGGKCCTSNGNACTGIFKDSSCCSGLCSSFTCVSCVGNGGLCTSPSDCCSGSCSSDLTCVSCISDGELCEQGSCCGGYCQFGMCASCLVEGSSCGSNSDCCSGNCLGGICLPFLR